METIFLIASIGALLINLIIFISILKIADNSDAIRKMIREEIKRQRAKDNPEENPTAEVKSASAKRIRLECPQCHVKEELNKSDLRNIFAYKNFVMHQGVIWDTIKFECKSCGTKFNTFINI